MTQITVNMKHILNGKIKRLPFDLEQCEKVDFVKSLMDALEMFMYERWPDGIQVEIIKKEKRMVSVGFLRQETEVEVRHTELMPQDYVDVSDNVIAFLLDNDFDTDIIILAMVYGLRELNLDFSAETDTFNRMFSRIRKFIVSDPDA